MISRITSLSRPSILTEIFSLDRRFTIQSSNGAREYFDVGFPVSEPFSPTGTILILFERTLLLRNKAKFLWGSIPDNGGVRNGFLPYLPKERYRDIRLDFQVFTDILSALDGLSEDCRRRVLQRQKSQVFCNSIEHIIARDVIDGMLQRPEEAARRLEFCLDGNATVYDSDIIAIFVPNTYKTILRCSRSNISRSKIIHYNPKMTVIQELRRHATLIDRCI